LNINQTIEDYARKLMVGLEGPLDSFIANFNSGIAEQNESMILVALEMLGEWSLTIISMLEHFDLTESDLYVDMSQSESITRCFFKILSLSLPEPSLSDPCFFSIANTKSHRSLNTTKTKTLAAINMILTNLLHNKAERLKAEKSTAQTIGIELTESPLTRLLEKVVPTFAVSLVAVCSMRDVPVCDRDTVDDLVTECLSTMGKMAREGRFSHHFALIYRTIIVNVCFVLLARSEEQIEQFEIDPKEYVVHSQDICDAQENDGLQTCSAALIDALCRFVDGALTFTVFFTIQSLDRSITNSPVDMNTPYLLEFAQISSYLTSP
jgi:hypothetical protein